MKVNNWEKCLEIGNKYEGPIANRIEYFLTQIMTKTISYAEQPDLQLSGIDVLLKKENVTADVKLRTKDCHDFYNKDIGFEEKTLMKNKYDIDSGTAGWFRKLYQEYFLTKNKGENKKHHVIAYVWETETGHNVEPIGYLIPMTPAFFEWYKKNKDRYTSNFAYTQKNNGENWWTLNRYIPLEKIPNEFLFKFNPKLCLSILTEQTKLFGDN